MTVLQFPKKTETVIPKVRAFKPSRELSEIHEANRRTQFLTGGLVSVVPFSDGDGGMTSIIVGLVAYLPKGYTVNNVLDDEWFEKTVTKLSSPK